LRLWEAVFDREDSMRQTPYRPADISLRLAQPEDRRAVTRVAQRDTASVPGAPLLVAVSPDGIRAAISLADGSVIADPFEPTAELVDLLRTRAKQTARAARGAQSSGWRRIGRRIAFASSSRRTGVV
jgi:hypothetical protein